MRKGPKGKRPPRRSDDIAEWRKRPVRQRLNAAERRARKAAALQLFVKQVGRRAQKGTEPNDRSSKRETTDAFRRIPTGELARLLRDGKE